MYGVFLKRLLKIQKLQIRQGEFAIFAFFDPFERAPRWAKSNRYVWRKALFVRLAPLV